MAEFSRRIEQMYKDCGYQLGWRLLYSPKPTLLDAKVVFLRLNPGGAKSVLFGDGYGGAGVISTAGTPRPDPYHHSLTHVTGMDPDPPPHRHHTTPPARETAGGEAPGTGKARTSTSDSFRRLQSPSVCHLPLTASPASETHLWKPGCERHPRHRWSGTG